MTYKGYEAKIEYDSKEMIYVGTLSNCSDLVSFHSSNIRDLLDKMDMLGMNRKQLAEKMNCSPQYISKVLKGRENLSLETLSKIEMALGISIIKEEPITV